MPTNKSLIVLQENSGQTPLDSSLPAGIRTQVAAVVDGLAERFEDILTTLQAAGKYDAVHLLTDNACSRARLLDALVSEAQRGRTTDLIVLGHGTTEKLFLKVTPHLRGGASQSIRSLLTDARARGVANLTLRMVYMCNCFGSTVNDDWLAIGAKVSIGSQQLDMMPEPMTTFFIHNWLAGQKAKDAAKNAYEATIPFYLAIYPPTARVKYKRTEVPFPCPTFADPFRTCKKTVDIPDGVEFTPHTYVEQTRLVVSGNQNARF